jgi:16S rRNA (cytosine1402-N4)-methyltransferase
MRHVPVLLKEIVESLEISKDVVPTIIDCNLGDGGHTQAIIERLDGKVKMVGFDLDGDAIDRATTNIFASKAAKEGKFAHNQFIVFRRNFKHMQEACAEQGIVNVDNIIFDLGLSSYELEESGRGFSFRKDEQLSMMFGTAQDHVFTASDIVNNWEEEHISTVITGYGEDRFASRIARAIINARGKRTDDDQPEHPITTTGQLAEIVKNAVPMYARFAKTHPATKTFQALRIAVNDELTALEEALPQAFGLLKPKGRLFVISYHSLEDRIVKNYFKTLSAEDVGHILTKRPTVPTDEEIERNPRSRSAKLRIIEKK